MQLQVHMSMPHMAHLQVLSDCLNSMGFSIQHQEIGGDFGSAPGALAQPDFAGELSSNCFECCFLSVARTADGDYLSAM